jgi:cell surface protein SprA
MKNQKILLYFLIIMSTIVQEACKKDKDNKNSEVKWDLKSLYSWRISSIPVRFPESKYVNDLSSGFNRSLINWYAVDPLFYSRTSHTPAYMTVDDFSNHYSRGIRENEIYDEADTIFISVMNLAYYPNERGPYNFDTYETEYSKGINSEGRLNNPETRWAGIQKMSPISIYDPIGCIEIWMMDPFIYNDITGDLYIDLGNISEDVLKDNEMAFEQGLPNSNDTTQYKTTAWGRIPKTDLSSLTFTYIRQQDVGLDGLSDEDERIFPGFQNYRDQLSEMHAQNLITDSAFSALDSLDVSNDDFTFFLDAKYDEEQIDAIRRYKGYNGTEANSLGTSSSSPRVNYTTPDIEDNVNDGMMDTLNRYTEYHIALDHSKFNIGTNFIDEIREPLVTLANGKQEKVKWYHFKIPLESAESGFEYLYEMHSAKLVRVYLTGFNEDVILRIAYFDLVKK